MLSGPSSAMNTITEGKAIIKDRNEKAFYNPAQVTNRDLSVIVMKCFQERRKAAILKNELKPYNRISNLTGKSKFQKKAGRNQEKERDIQKEEERESLGVREKDNLYEDRVTKFANQFQVFEGLAASGVRAIRYALEVPDVIKVIANDIDPLCFEIINDNIKLNNKNELIKKIEVLNEDAISHMILNQYCYEVIDLDPYGSPIKYLDAAMHSVSEGGLLCITATDLTSLAGNNPETCFARYGSVPIKRSYMHESGLRIVLYAIEKAANKYERYILPLLSLKIDFYFRIFVQVFSGQTKAQSSGLKMSYIFQSNGCDSYYLKPLLTLKDFKDEDSDKNSKLKYIPSLITNIPNTCPETSANMKIGGPIWSDPLHDRNFIEMLLEELKGNYSKYKMAGNLKGILLNAQEEIEAPLYIDLHSLCKTIGVVVPKMQLISNALKNGGYQTSRSHICKTAIKTDAPMDFIWDIFRTFHQASNVKNKKYFADETVQKILDKKIKNEISFKNTDSGLSLRNAKRYVDNPKNWGPGTIGKSRRNIIKDEDTHKMEIVKDTAAGEESKQKEENIDKMDTDSSKRSKEDLGNIGDDDVDMNESCNPKKKKLNENTNV